MLQALKLDPAARPAANRERETGPDLQDPAFSGYLATAANFARLTGPVPAAAPPPRPEPPAPRPEPRRATDRNAQASERPSGQEAECRMENAKSEDRVEDARPKAKEPEDASRNSETPREPGAATPAKAGQPDSKPTEAAPANAPSQPQSPVATAWAGTALPQAQAQAMHNQAQEADAQGLKVAAQHATAASAPAPAPTAKAQAALEQAVPGVQLRLHFSEGAPSASSAKPALTELLSIPKPEIQVPKPVLGANRPEPVVAKEIPGVAAVAAFKAVESPAASLPTTPLNLAGREAILAATPKGEVLPGKGASIPGVPIAAAGPAAVKGTTPVLATEPAQGAKANPTFTQLDGTIKWLLRNQEKGAEIQLNPESLGRVVIKLRIEGGEVHAKLWASEASTVPLLQDQKTALEASLRQQGLSLGSFDLQQGQRGNDARATPQPEPAPSGAGIAQSGSRKQDVPIVSPALLGGAHLIEVFA